MTCRVIKIYQPWPAPVRAARNDDPSVLPEIQRWVTALRDQGLVAPDVAFTITSRRGRPVGVLRDRVGERELPPHGFLVFGRDGLRVLDEPSFFRLYHDPDSDSDTLP